MKKFISFVMAATMVASLVPATAFAATGGFKATAKIVNAVDVSKDDAASPVTGAELQIKVTDTDYLSTLDDFKMSFKLYLDNAEWSFANAGAFDAAAEILDKDGNSKKGAAKVTVTASDFEDDYVKFTVAGSAAGGTLTDTDKYIVKDDVIVIPLNVDLTKTNTGTVASVSVESDAVTADDMAFATVESKGIKASIRKTVDIAEEEVAGLYTGGIVIQPLVGTFKGGNPAAGEKDGDIITLKLSKGFEFKGDVDALDIGTDIVVDNTTGGTDTVEVVAADTDENIITLRVVGASDPALNDATKITVKNLQIEAVSAKEGDVATIKVAQKLANSVTLEVAKVIGYGVKVSVDEDEDVPVMFSGVDAENKGLTAGEDNHQSLKVTLEETYPGAWNFKKGFTMSLPEGVFVTAVDIDSANMDKVNDVANGGATEWANVLKKAYKDGGYEYFEVARRAAEGDAGETEKASLDLEFTLVADPNFSGDVVLTVEGESIDKQEVTIANFVPAYTVKAEQNDMIIDYRNTAIPTEVVVTEGAAGLWAKNAPATTIGLVVERMDFEGDPTFTVDDKSELTLKNAGITRTNQNNNVNGDGIAFTVKAESYDEVASVTVSDMELYMGRSLAAGAYDLKLDGSASVGSTGTITNSGTLYGMYLAQTLYSAATGADTVIVGNETDFNGVVKEAFINVVTAGRDQDDASFTTKVVVPVGESYLLSGETKVELDAPAYVNAAGYTMLPVRAVAKALGVNNNNVLWNAEARTVTIMYGQRIITMTVGQKVVYVNGSALPATAAVEISKDRTFLGMRDLSTALGVTDITWDAATKTATMNGGK